MDKNRRQFLKILFIGSGMFIMGKVLGALFSKSWSSSLFREKPLKKSLSKRVKTGSLAFRVVDNDSTFSVYDESGEEVFQIDKKK